MAEFAREARVSTVLLGLPVVLILLSCSATQADTRSASARRQSRRASHSRTLEAEEYEHEPTELEFGEDEGAVRRAFTDIYDGLKWSAAGGGSGTGSTREVTTAAVSAIRLVANTYGLRSLVDAPCGAFLWQPLLLQLLEDDFSDFRFLGLDVVQSVIQANAERHAGRPNWQFQAKDLSTESVPSGYDLLLSRDALQHLPCLTAVKALQSIAESEARYLLLGSYSKGSANLNINLGDYFLIDLRAAPFNMAEGVLRVFQEHTSMIDANEVDKELLLFSGKYVQTLDFEAMRSGCALLPSKYA